MDGTIKGMLESRATGRDFLMVFLGMTAGGALAAAAFATLETQWPQDVARAPIAPSHAGDMSSFATPRTGLYQMAISEGLLWRLDTTTGALEACSPAVLESGAPALACSPMPTVDFDVEAQSGSSDLTAQADPPRATRW
jgi:hypothetical protein